MGGDWLSASLFNCLASRESILFAALPRNPAGSVSVPALAESDAYTGVTSSPREIHQSHVQFWDKSFAVPPLHLHCFSEDTCKLHRLSQQPGRTPGCENCTSARRLILHPPTNPPCFQAYVTEPKYCCTQKSISPKRESALVSHTAAAFLDLASPYTGFHVTETHAQIDLSTCLHSPCKHFVASVFRMGLG